MKKIKILTFTGLLLMGFNSCYKEPIKYNLKFNNISSDTYLIEVNGKSDFVYGNTFIDYYFVKDTYSYKATQQGGYILYPTIYEGTINLNTDQILTID